MFRCVTSRWAPDSHESAWAALGNGALECGDDAPCVAEKLMPFDAGASVSSARDFFPRYFMAVRPLHVRASERFMRTSVRASCRRLFRGHAGAARPRPPPKGMIPFGNLYCCRAGIGVIRSLSEHRSQASPWRAASVRFAPSPARNAPQDFAARPPRCEIRSISARQQLDQNSVLSNIPPSNALLAANIYLLVSSGSTLLLGAVAPSSRSQAS